MLINNLTPKELSRFPVWYFPTDDGVTIEPITKEEELSDYTVIIKALFLDSKQQEYIGYLYWGEPSTIEYIRPVMFLDEAGSSEITFWNGMFEPEENDLVNLVKSCILPITYQSIEIFGLYPIRGVINRIYYLNNKRQVDIKK